MRNLPNYLLAIALTCSTAFADDLDKKQAGALKRADNLIGQLTEQLSGMEPSRFNDRIKGDYERRVGGVGDKLAELPADHPDVKAVLERHAALKAKLAELSAGLAKTQGDAADARAAIEKTLAAPEFTDDLEALKAMVEQFGSSSRYEFNHYLYGRWPGHDMVEEMKTWSAGWEGTQKKFAALKAKYGKLVEYRSKLDGPSTFKLTDVKIALRDAEDRFPSYEAAVKQFVTGAPAEIEKQAAALKAAATEAVAKRNHEAFTLWESKVSQARYRVMNIAKIYVPLAPPDERAKIEARAAAIEEDTDKLANQLAELMIRENRAPGNGYAGADRKAIEAMVRAEWGKLHAGESIVAVRLPSDAWERKTAWVYDTGMNGFVKRDRSSMLVWVLVKDGPKQIAMWPVAALKLHLHGDKLALDEGPRPGRGAPPSQKMLAANFK